MDKLNELEELEKLYVILKMMDIKYSIFENYGTMIKLKKFNKEVILAIANYLETNKFKWIYILSHYYYPDEKSEHEYDTRITDIEVYHLRSDKIEHAGIASNT